MKKVKLIKCYHGESVLVLTKEEEKEKMENTKKEETLEENLASYTDILNQYCATLDEFTKEYKAQSKLICNSLKDIIKFLKN